MTDQIASLEVTFLDRYLLRRNYFCGLDMQFDIYGRVRTGVTAWLSFVEVQ
jgi:hypothetical protein